MSNAPCPGSHSLAPPCSVSPDARRGDSGEGPGGLCGDLNNRRDGHCHLSLGSARPSNLPSPLSPALDRPNPRPLELSNALHPIERRDLPSLRRNGPLPQYDKLFPHQRPQDGDSQNSDQHRARRAGTAQFAITAALPPANCPSIHSGRCRFLPRCIGLFDQRLTLRRARPQRAATCRGSAVPCAEGHGSVGPSLAAGPPRPRSPQTTLGPPPGPRRRPSDLRCKDPSLSHPAPIQCLCPVGQMLN
jgi:hypothetical protein